MKIFDTFDNTPFNNKEVSEKWLSEKILELKILGLPLIGKTVYVPSEPQIKMCVSSIHVQREAVVYSGSICTFTIKVTTQRFSKNSQTWITDSFEHTLLEECEPDNKHQLHIKNLLERAAAICSNADESSRILQLLN